jgi:hypothetical protein
MTHPVKVYIDPASHHFLGDRLFRPDDAARLNGDRQEAPYVHLRERFIERGIEIHTADFLPERVDESVLHIYFSLGRLSAVEALKRRADVVLGAFFAMECPIVEPSLFRALPRVARHFRRVYSWSDSPSLERFTGQPLELHSFRWPQSFDDVHEDLWRQTTGRKFLVMINANKLPRIYWQELYTERMRAVEFFVRTGEIDLYGKGWDNPSMRVGKTWVPWTFRLPWLALQKRYERRFPDPRLVAVRQAWKGVVASKAETLAQYDFALCFENCVLKGWITEKLFDCLFAGTVPVYWGAPEIREVVPPDCFIDMRDFSGYPALRDFLKSRSAEHLRQYRRAAREFLASAQYRQFNRESFTALFESCVDEITAAPRG